MALAVVESRRRRPAAQVVQAVVAAAEAISLRLGAT